MAPGDIAQIMSAVEGLHGGINTLSKGVGKLQGHVEGIQAWIATHPAVCPLGTRDKLMWRVIQTLLQLSGWAVAAIVILKFLAEKG